MTGEEALARIRKSLQRTADETPAAKSLIEKIRSGKATYQDTALYARWAATNLGLSLSHVVCDIDLSDRAAVCKALLLDQYEDINGFVDMVQAELDSSFGIHLAPQRAPFAAERADTIGQSLADTTKPDDVIRRRAQSATATAIKAIHDDRMKAEARFRSRAGLKCHITRTAVGGCCPWCSEVAGKFEAGEEPEGIFRRHDNCDCTVYYENSRVRQTLQGAVGEDGKRTKTWEVIEETERQHEPTVLTAAQAAEIEAKHQPTVLTGGKKPAIIRIEDIQIGRSVGAKAKNYDIMDLSTGEIFHLVKGSRLQDVQVFAGKGTRTEFRDAAKYAERYGGSPDDWQHAKGIGMVDFYGEEIMAELHWVQCDGIGRFEFFVKRWFE